MPRTLPRQTVSHHVTVPAALMRASSASKLLLNPRHIVRSLVESTSARVPHVRASLEYDYSVMSTHPITPKLSPLTKIFTNRLHYVAVAL